MTSEELVAKMNAAIYDPNMMIMEAYDNIKQNEITIPDPSNPFMFLLENNALVTAGAMQSMESSFRRNYPVLATTKEELYGHLNTDETNDIFAIPSTGIFNLYLGLSEVLEYGKDYETYTLVTIPKYSTIEVDGYTFTTLNDILLYVYPNKTVFAKYLYNDMDISSNVDVILESSIIVDADDKEWVYININVKQMKRYYFRETLVSSTQYKNTINLNDNERYSYMKIGSINKQTNSFIDLDITYSNYIYNPNKPTMIVNPADTSINVELPITYSLNGLVYSYLDFELFTTRGDVKLPLKNYDTIDYKFTAYIPETTDESIIGISNIPVKVNSSVYTYGGKNELTFEELKNKIVNYATGDNTIPITISEVKSMLENNKFTFSRVENTILKNNILISKDIGNLEFDTATNINTIHSDIQLLLNNTDSSKIIPIDDDKIVIEPYQLFKLVDGVITPLSDLEKNTINDISVNDIQEYNKNKIYFTLYKYVLDYSDILSIRVYDINTPSIAEYKNLYTIQDTIATVSIESYDIIFKGDSYDIIIGVKNTPELDLLDINKLFGELYVKKDGHDPIYYKGYFTKTTDTLYLKFTIEVTSYIDKDDNVVVKGGYGAVTSTSIGIENICDISIYSTDNSLANIVTNTPYDITIEPSTLILHREQFNLFFGKRLNNLYTYYDIEYTDRKFVRYTEDVPMTYTKDIYQTDPDGTLTVTPIDTDDDGVDDDIVLTKLHSVGDIVYDDEGNVVYKYRVGDIVIDENTLLPVVDINVGVIHKFPLMLIEDVFLRTTSDIYNEYRVNFFIELTSIITDQIDTMNTSMLDNTALKYIPNITIKDVKLNNNNVITTYSNNIKPTINIYINNTDTLTIDDTLRNGIYNILQRELYNTTTVGSIEQMIYNILPTYVLTVRIVLIDGVELSVINYTEDSSKFIINKVLSYTDEKDLIVTPDMKINIVTI